MAQDDARYDFEKFNVQVKYVGEEEDGPAYQTTVEAPGFEPVHSGVVLMKLPMFSTAARFAVSQLRGLLAEGVKAFLEDYRKNSGVISLKEIQDKRLVFLSWHDLASAVGDEAFAAAEAELKVEEGRESKEVYGREQAEEPEGPQEPLQPDVSYQLGLLVMDVHHMGMIEKFPFFGVVASVPETELKATTIIGVKSPLISHAVEGMVENLKGMLNYGVERYLAEEARVKGTKITTERRIGAENLYAVASHVGAEGLAEAERQVQELIEQERSSFEDKAIAAMEEEIATRKKRLNPQ